MIGKTFHHVYADGNCKWKVKSAKGAGVWVCEIIDCPDYAGHQQLFSTAQVNGFIAAEKHLQQHFARSDAFYANLKPGQIVHYCNGGKAWVRLKAERRDGQMVCIPIALVGEWRDYDLPHRSRTGELVEGYHAKAIRAGEPFQTPASNIYECPQRPASHNRDGNPANLPALPLDVPEPTEAENARIALWRKLEEVSNVLQQHSEQDPEKLLAQIRAIVGKRIIGK